LTKWMKKWCDIERKEVQAKAKLLQDMADQGFTRSKAAQELDKHTHNISHYVKKFGLVWPIKTSGAEWGRRGYTVQDYKDLAAKGMSKAEAAKTFGVHWNTVDGVARRNEIKFADGRRKS
jgi:hypothetical protein